MALIIGPTSKRNRATGLVIANSVTGQVINQLIDQARHTFDHHGLRLVPNGHIRLPGNLLKTLFHRQNGARELDGLCGPNRHRLALGCSLRLIQVGKREDVVNERCQAARLAIDATAKVAQIVLALNHAVCNKLGVARNRGKRGLELMSDIGRELTTHAVVIGQHRHRVPSPCRARCPWR